MHGGGVGVGSGHCIRKQFIKHFLATSPIMISCFSHLLFVAVSDIRTSMFLKLTLVWPAVS